MPILAQTFSSPFSRPPPFPPFSPIQTATMILCVSAAVHEECWRSSVLVVSRMGEECGGITWILLNYLLHTCLDFFLFLHIIIQRVIVVILSVNPPPQKKSRVFMPLVTLVFQYKLLLVDQPFIISERQITIIHHCRHLPPLLRPLRLLLHHHRLHQKNKSKK